MGEALVLTPVAPGDAPAGAATLRGVGGVAARAEPPLVVDMDGTLIRTDTLIESLFVLARHRLGALPGVLARLARGRAAFKAALAARAMPDIDTLPLREDLMAFLRAQAARGRRLVLATGADERVARGMAERLGIFELVMASDARVNLVGEAKRARLVQEFGERGYDYVGGGWRDVAVWRSARHAIVAGGGRRLRECALREAPGGEAFAGDGGRAQAWLRQLRWHHWIKNLLVFVPLAIARGQGRADALALAALAFAAFCAAASSVYLLNDLADLPADRRHPVKRLRPIACGLVPVGQALAAVPLLWLVTALLALPAGGACSATLGVYVASMIVYSMRLKGVKYVDALVLGGGYTLRLVAGAAAIGQGVPLWLCGWSLPTFFGLALLKRRADLAQPHASAPAQGRTFVQADVPLLGRVGRVACWTGAAALAAAPWLAAGSMPAAWAVWCACALLMAWISRMWNCAERGRITGDPVSFALRDPRSRAFGLATVLLLLLAR